MPTFNYEAKNTGGDEVRDSLEAGSEEEAQQKIREKGYFVTKIVDVAAQKAAREKRQMNRAGQLTPEARSVRRGLLWAALALMVFAVLVLVSLRLAMQQPGTALAWLLDAATVLTVGFTVLVGGPILFGEVRLQAAESQSTFWRWLEWLRSTFAGESPSYSSPHRP